MPRGRALPLKVYLNGRLVGKLHRAGSGAVNFRYDPTWLDWASTFAISHALPLREDAYVGDTVVAVFDNLLPDEGSVRRRMASCTRAAGTDVVSLLAAVGRDCVGALQFLPEDEEPGPAGHVDARPLDDDEIARILVDLEQSPLGVDADGAFRISLAGAQEKTALLWWRNAWHLPRGTTATTHILKPTIGKTGGGLDLSDSVENEHLCLSLVAALGLSVAKSRVAEFGDRRTLVVERFDREWSSDGRLLRLPQEDLCQALAVPSTRKYESEGGPGVIAMLDVLRASDDPAADRRALLQAMIVYWLLGATDAHAKNFSLALRPGGGFRLAPFYDVVSLQPHFDRGELRRNQLRFAVALGNRRHTVLDKIDGRHFAQIEKAAGLPVGIAQDIAAEIVDRSRGAVDRVSDELSDTVGADLMSSILGGYHQRLQRLEAWIEGS